MIGRASASLSRLRRSISRSEWLTRLLRLPLSTDTENEPGLVLIQIDGLPQQEFEKALARGEMPFLRRLIERQHYRVHRQYAGIPAATAAVQCELFYGVKGAVPGFNFMDRSTGELVRMFEPSAAARIERELEETPVEPLLKDGSCYVDNFTGGAAEPHFCPSARGWGPHLRDANPLVVAFFLLTNIYSFLRTGVLLVVELVLAIGDCLYGFARGENLIKELKFVPTRVVISILLRELATIGVQMDVARGLPIIHVNFLGYDEQSHRRGPASRFAHWTLKGIDDAIARIWRAAHRSARRNYDVWIYSDHGQEHVQAYEKVHGRSFAAAVAEVFAVHEGEPVAYRSSGEWGVQLQRVRQFGGARVQRLLSANDTQEDKRPNPSLFIAALGPVAMVYYQKNLKTIDRAVLAQALVQQAGAPLVMIKEGTDRARAWTSAGEFMLPQDAAGVLGAEHPFLDEAAQDLVGLCHHPDAGDFVVCGWCDAIPAYSFTTENGAHGGAAPQETNAFALLPRDTVLPARGRDYLRAVDLRHAALHFLGRSSVSIPRVAREAVAPPRTLRIMTYNVHSCIGMDGRLAPERIARMIARYDVDIVALQELDVSRLRTGGVDQAHRIAQLLEMDFHFHPAIHLEEERYGDAILTHLPMQLFKAGGLPEYSGNRWIEPRGALWVKVDLGGAELQVMNTHLGLTARERRVQVDALLGPEWLGHPECHSPLVFCGDFNAIPSSPVCRLLRGRLNDAQLAFERRRPRGTFFGHFPFARIDHVFLTPDLEVVDIEIPNTQMARIASDHLPLIVEVKVPVKNTGTADKRHD